MGNVNETLAARRNTAYDEHGNAISPQVLEERETEEALRQAEMQVSVVTGFLLTRLIYLYGMRWAAGD